MDGVAQRREQQPPLRPSGARREVKQRQCERELKPCRCSARAEQVRHCGAYARGRARRRAASARGHIVDLARLEEKPRPAGPRRHMEESIASAWATLLRYLPWQSRSPPLRQSMCFCRRAAPATSLANPMRRDMERLSPSRSSPGLALAGWLAANPGGPRLQIGDLSPKGGGPCPNGRRDAQGNPLFHKSHRGGIDFDVQIIRADRKELFRSVQISDPSTHGPTQILVTLIEEQGRGHLRFIFTAGTRFLKGAHLQYEAEPTYHLHVRLFQ
jgi:hypothetical protein